ncbi:hypothetical protein DL96DRAFT_1821338 [Flagelloscypha sp. PMI_526]|nr:hypothetical protein DL96DRAFT_1821338 [Flagelloscypha sp. PMI_526]
MSTEKTALIIGATGRTGSRLLPLLLASDSGFTKVAEYGRRVTPKDKLGVNVDKLEQKVIDFDKIHESGLKDGKWDVVFITLATQRARAGSAEAFERIDKGYVLDAAKEAKSSDPKFKQRVIYVSSAGANPSSFFLYPRCKGETEDGLASLGYSETIIFRPGFLRGDDRGLVEKMIGPITTFGSHFSSSLEIQLDQVAKSMLNIGKLGLGGIPSGLSTQESWNKGSPFNVLGNASLLKLSQVNA